MSNAWESETDKRITELERWKEGQKKYNRATGETIDELRAEWKIAIGCKDDWKIWHHMEKAENQLNELKNKIEELDEKLGKTALVEEIYNKIIDGSLFSQIPVIKEMKDEIFKYKMGLKKDYDGSNIQSSQLKEGDLNGRNIFEKRSK